MSAEEISVVEVYGAGGCKGGDTRERVSNNSLVCSENTKEGAPTLITVLLAKLL